MEHPSSGFAIRPRFQQLVDLPEVSARSRIVETFESEPDDFEIRSMNEFVVVHMPEKVRKRWSPRLQLSLEDRGNDQTRIVGVYGPAHEVWAQYILGYIFIGSAALFSGIYGGVQIFLNQPPWALWITGAMLVIACFMYLGAQLGQKLGAWQTFQLHQAYQKAIDRPFLDPDVELGSNI